MSSDTSLAGRAKKVFLSQISLALARYRSSGSLAGLTYASVASAMTCCVISLVNSLASKVKSRW